MTWARYGLAELSEGLAALGKFYGVLVAYCGMQRDVERFEMQATQLERRFWFPLVVSA